MNKTIGILILSLLIPAVAACTKSEPATATFTPSAAVQSVSPEVTKKPEEQPTASAASSEEPAGTPTETKSDTTADSLKQEGILGLSSDEVSAKYGNPQAETDENNYLIMRYDFPEEGYQYPETVISVDVKGLTDKKMLAQLIVDYGDDSMVDAYSVFYLKDAEVMQYRVTKDGAEEYPASAD